MNVQTKLAIGLLTTVIGIFFGGTVFKQLWEWFVVPLGTQAISLPHAIGILATFRLFFGPTGLDHGREADADDRLISGLAASITVPSVALAFGYVCTLFM